MHLGSSPARQSIFLVDVLIHYHLLDPYESLPYDAFNPLLHVAADTLAALGAEKAGFVVPRLMEAIPAIPTHAMGAPIDALFGVTFNRTKTPVIREHLTDLQRAVLDVLVATPSVWQYTIRAEQLARYGLPMNHDKLQRFLEG